jgi:hypothetical protein
LPALEDRITAGQAGLADVFGVPTLMSFMSSGLSPEQPGIHDAEADPSQRLIRNPLKRCWRDTMFAIYESPQTVLLCSVAFPFLSLMLGSAADHTLRKVAGPAVSAIAGLLLGLVVSPIGWLVSASAAYRALHPGEFRNALVSQRLTSRFAFGGAYILCGASFLAAVLFLSCLVVYSRLPVPIGPVLTVITGYAGATYGAFAILHAPIYVRVLLSSDTPESIGETTFRVFRESWRLVVTSPGYHFCNLFAAGLTAALCARTIFLIPIAMGGVFMMLAEVSANVRLVLLKQQRASEETKGDSSQ